MDGFPEQTELWRGRDLSHTAQHQPLRVRELLPLPPQSGLEGHGAEGFPHLRRCGPAGGTVLAVAHIPALDAVQAAPVGEGGDGHQGSERYCQQENQRPGIVTHVYLSLLLVVLCV